MVNLEKALARKMHSSEKNMKKSDFSSQTTSDWFKMHEIILPTFWVEKKHKARRIASVYQREISSHPT